MDKQKIRIQCQQALDEATRDPQKVPGIFFAAIGKDGELITTNTSGTRRLGGEQPMDLETTLWMASCTKLMTSILCMQLVDQGKVKLDDPKHLYQYCPELERIKVLQDDGSLVDRKNDITLRMLLAHTAGFGYEFTNEKFLAYSRPIGVGVGDGILSDYLNSPLMNQPGERWEYGYNVDWAGFYCERVTGLRLNELMQQLLIKPLGLENTSMFPNKSMRANLASMHQRYPGSSTLHVADHPFKMLWKDVPEGMLEYLVQSGGAGMYARPVEYLQILAMLLNDGTSPTTGAQILKPETVEEMFKNQIPQFPNYGRPALPACKLDLINPAPELLPQKGDPPQGWGLGLQLVSEGIPGMRSAGTGSWCGLANLFYFVDRDKGVAGLTASQILPFLEGPVLEAAGKCEAALYAGLG